MGSWPYLESIMAARSALHLAIIPLSYETGIQYEVQLLVKFARKSTTIFHGPHSYRPKKWRHKMFKTQVDSRLG